MGLQVAAVDLGPEKMALARKLGAEITIDAKWQDPTTDIQGLIAGAHGVLATAVSTAAFKQAIGMLRRGGTCVLNGLPAGEFPLSIFDVVLNGYTVRGSIVGTRLDLEEALAFAVLGYDTLRGRAAGWPAVTGARHAAVLGALAPYRLRELLVKIDAELAAN